MKSLIGVVFGVALICLAGLAGCDNGAEKKDAPTADDVKAQAQKAVQTAVEFGKQKQAELMAAMNEQYQKMADQGSALLEKAKAKAAEGQEKAKELAAELEQKQAEVQAKLKVLKDSSGEAWKAAQEDLKKAMADLQSAYDKAKGRVQGLARRLGVGGSLVRGAGGSNDRQQRKRPEGG